MNDQHAKNSADTGKTRQGSLLKRILKGFGAVLVLIVVLVALLLAFLSASEFKPADTEVVAVEGESSRTVSQGDPFRIVSWNIGYGALGEDADFFMDGGSMVRTVDSAESLESNMSGISNEILSRKADVLFLQETDRDSTRSFNVDELQSITESVPGYSVSFANNFKAAYVPYPIPPIGKVDSGIATLSSYAVDSAERIQLPIPFKWPVSMVNLKRCLLVSRLPVQGTDKELVLVNLHLEAYDNGEGKTKQTNMLADIIKAEAEKGNYVIVGGDFNQIFSSSDDSRYPVSADKWQPGKIQIETFGDGWQFLMDEDVPSCRSLDRPYAGADKENFQYYLIDGFIVSDNIKVKKCDNQDLGFVYSDHNPVILDAELTVTDDQAKAKR
ncbi:MAG: endonuclease [Clostridiales bacterium]|nr:endonuclease [Clostridiales bacterium]